MLHQSRDFLQLLSHPCPCAWRHYRGISCKDSSKLHSDTLLGDERLVASNLMVLLLVANEAQIWFSGRNSWVMRDSCYQRAAFGCYPTAVGLILHTGCSTPAFLSSASCTAFGKRAAPHVPHQRVAGEQRGVGYPGGFCWHLSGPALHQPQSKDPLQISTVASRPLHNNVHSCQQHTFRNP